jgi:hypothetical protein
MSIPPSGVILKAIAAFEGPALCALACLVSACDRPPAPVEAPQPVVQERAEPVPSPKQIADRSEQCRQKSSEAFRRSRKDPEKGAAAFTSHYNARMNSCFYLVTVDNPGEQSRTLYDLSEGELYGEFLGPAEGEPKTCRLIAFYCASGREWDVLVRPYMES